MSGVRLSYTAYKRRQIPSIAAPVCFISVLIWSVAFLRTLSHDIVIGKEWSAIILDCATITPYLITLMLPATICALGLQSNLELSIISSHLIRSLTLGAVGLGWFPNAEAVASVLRGHAELVLEVVLASTDQVGCSLVNLYQSHKQELLLTMQHSSSFFCNAWVCVQMNLRLMMALHAFRQSAWMLIWVAQMDGPLHRALVRGLINWVVMVMFSWALQCRNRRAWKQLHLEATSIAAADASSAQPLKPWASQEEAEAAAFSPNSTARFEGNLSAVPGDNDVPSCDVQPSAAPYANPVSRGAQKSTAEEAVNECVSIVEGNHQPTLVTGPCIVERGDGSSNEPPQRTSTPGFNEIADQPSVAASAAGSSLVPSSNSMSQILSTSSSSSRARVLDPATNIPEDTKPFTADVNVALSKVSSMIATHRQRRACYTSCMRTQVTAR